VLQRLDNALTPVAHLLDNKVSTPAIHIVAASPNRVRVYTIELAPCTWHDSFYIAMAVRFVQTQLGATLREPCFTPTPLPGEHVCAARCFTRKVFNNLTVLQSDSLSVFPGDTLITATALTIWHTHCWHHPMLLQRRTRTWC
jgi:hypothetical protein